MVSPMKTIRVANRALPTEPMVTSSPISTRL